MKLLLILLSFMTLTVKDKNTVELTDGQWPYDIEVSYSNTYNKGQVRAGDVATLILSNLGNITVEQITMAMRSNDDAGKGTVTVDAGEEQIASKTVTYKTVSEVVKIYTGSKAGVDSLTIRTKGSENSLYIDSYTISYSVLPPSTVTLMNGDEVYTSLSGASVTLPSMTGSEEWRFIGWTAQPFSYMSTMPDLIPAGNYRPTSDVTLWAAYEYVPSLDQAIVTDLQDGVYVYANWASQMAMSGGVWNGELGVSVINTENTNQCYQVTFDADGLATIQLIYVYGTEYIGYSGTNLVNQPSKWQVYHDGEKTAFYTVVNNRNYMLFPGKIDGYGSVCSTDIVLVNDLSTTPTVLLSTEPLQEEPVYTCYPERPMGLTNEGVNELMNERVIRFGIYELMIKNGHKYLRIR